MNIRNREVVGPYKGTRPGPDLSVVSLFPYSFFSYVGATPGTETCGEEGRVGRVVGRHRIRKFLSETASTVVEGRWSTSG